MGSEAGGFNFDLCKRNAMLEAKGVQLPKAWKTGTTIAGIVFKVSSIVQASHVLQHVPSTFAKAANIHRSQVAFE